MNRGMRCRQNKNGESDCISWRESLPIGGDFFCWKVLDMKTEKKLLLSVLPGSLYDNAVCSGSSCRYSTERSRKKEAAEFRTAEAGDAVQQTEEKNHNLGETVVTAQRVRKRTQYSGSDNGAYRKGYQKSGLSQCG